MKKVKLSDVCNFSEDRTSVASLNETRYISTENLLPNRGGITDAVTLPKTSSTPAFVAGNILISNIRPYFKKIWYATFDGGCSADVLVFKADENIDAKFLYYVLSEDKFFDYMTATAKGTKMPRGDKQSIMNYSVPNFSLAKQKKIAALLGTLDDKIALNKKINATLEAMAKTLYDYWFVQFDFPDEHSKPYKTSGGKMVYSSELGRDIPAGWKVGTLEDFATYATKKISSEKIPRNRYIATDNMLPNAQGVTVSQYEPSESSVHEFTSGDVLLANIRPHFKKVWLAHFSGGCSSDVLVIRPKNFSEAEYIFSTLSRDDFFSYDVAGAKGTKMPRGDKVHIMSYPMLINNDLIERYVAFVRPMYFKLCKLHLESRRLAALRDWLLPMLMNGQVDFKKGEN